MSAKKTEPKREKTEAERRASEPLKTGPLIEMVVNLYRLTLGEVAADTARAWYYEQPDHVWRGEKPPFMPNDDDIFNDSDKPEVT